VLGLPNTQAGSPALKARQTECQVAAAWGAANGHGLPSAQA